MSSTGRCDKCGEMSRLKPRVKRIRNKTDMHYFECDHCNHIYIICYMDESIRRKTKRARKLRDLKYKRDEHYERIELLNKEIKRDMDALMKKMAKDVV